MNHSGSVICVSCPFNMRYSSVLTVTCPEVDRSTTQVEQTSTDTYNISTGCLAHENQTNRRPFQVLNILVQNSPKDKTGQNGYYLTRNAFTARGTDKKKHVNVC